ncbi:MAG: GAF domain-containing sensor histidine kinase [Chloroflexi bacterium]|nr:GAF domain-containing sensor histidine kinase [Chloroflexota bacterium]
MLPGPPSTRRKAKRRQVAARLQLLLPMFVPEDNCGQPADLGQLLKIMWELASSEAKADGLVIRFLTAGLSSAHRTSFGFRVKSECSPVEAAVRWSSRTGQPVVLSRDAPPAMGMGRQLDQSGLASLASFPLIGNGQKLGVAVALKAARKPSFNNEQLGLLQVLCQQVAMALARIQLVNEVNKLKGTVEWLTMHYLDAQEKQRRKICLDLHDGVAQWMMAAKQRIQTFDLELRAAPETAGRIREVEHMLSQSIGELRSVMADLQPPQVGEQGLPLVLLRMISTLSCRTGIHSHFRITGKEQPLPPNTQVAIYRIVQESLSNVRKHAEAKDVTVILDHRDSRLALTVKDNGRGFDVSRTLASGESDGTLGLVGIKERAEALAGSFDISSRPGAGTTVSVVLPLPPGAGPSLSAVAGLNAGLRA